LVSQSPEILPKLHFININPRVRVTIEAALALGTERLNEKIKQGAFVLAGVPR
jgi:hypothetical protein